MAAPIPKVLKIKKTAVVEDPQRGTEGSAGYDLHLPYDVTLDPRRLVEVSLGIAVQIPKGYVGLLKLRSSIAKEYAVAMYCGGVIDSDYRGELKAVVSTHHNRPLQHIEKGTRMFQLLLVPCLTAEVEVVEELSKTKRGEQV